MASWVMLPGLIFKNSSGLQDSEISGNIIITSDCCCLQVEPFYVTLSLFDIQNGRKISSDFQVDLNHQSVRGMVPSNASQYVNGGGEARSEGQRFIHGVPESALLYPKQVERKLNHGC